MLDFDYGKKLLQLKSLGFGEFSHLNSTLEDHLIGTHKILKNWSCPNYLCDAGLYHASYSTQPMKKLGIPYREFRPEQRTKIQEIIGVKAESIVYLYCANDRKFMYPTIGKNQVLYRDRFMNKHIELTPQQLSDILKLTIANELEICANNKGFRNENRVWYLELFSRFSPYVSPKTMNYIKNTLEC